MCGPDSPVWLSGKERDNYMKVDLVSLARFGVGGLDSFVSTECGTKVRFVIKPI